MRWLLQQMGGAAEEEVAVGSGQLLLMAVRLLLLLLRLPLWVLLHQCLVDLPVALEKTCPLVH